MEWIRNLVVAKLSQLAGAALLFSLLRLSPLPRLVLLLLVLLVLLVKL